MHHFREMNETLSFLMDQHRFPYMHKCEDLFTEWATYDGENEIGKSPRPHESY